MNITLTDIGQKLRTFRDSLDLSQKDLAASMGVHQNQISRIENGLGGSIELILQLLNFYGSRYLVSFVFSEEFKIVKSSEEGPSNPLNSIAVEKLAMLEGEINTQFREVTKLLTA